MSIDFKGIADAALAQAESLLVQWVGGKRAGHEWTARKTVEGGLGDSLTTNLHTGAWLHGATQDAGGDLVSLYAYVYGRGMVDAAKAVGELVGMPVPALPTYTGRTASAKPQEPSPAPAVAGVKAAADDKGVSVPIHPVPGDAPPAPLFHPVRKKPAESYEYRDSSGALIGYVRRFIKSDGLTKETLPQSFCENSLTGERSWRWVGFAKPRGLYGLQHLSPIEAGRPVLIVEGEKCVDVAMRDEALWAKYDVISWCGGVNGAKHADFSPLAGRACLLWADCDSLPDKEGTTLPYQQQPGFKVMTEIGTRLLAMQCRVKRLRIPPMGSVPSGWDIADMLHGGLSGESPITGKELLLWMKERAEAFAVAPQGAGELTPVTAGAAQSPEVLEAMHEALGAAMVHNGVGKLVDCQHNVFYALTMHPELKGLVVYDEFRQCVMRSRAAPWGAPAGKWVDSDDGSLGLWLLEKARLHVKADKNVGLGVAMAANAVRVHPPRDYFNGLVWDGIDRTGDWLAVALGVESTPYTRLVGPLMLRGAVSRIFSPGNKFDYSMVLEGTQGKGKSTALRILGGDWFEDSPIKVGDKDGYMILQGKWIIEIAEMDSFNRAETTAVKQFISTQTDTYREPYGKRMMDKPRQCVFFATTNSTEYLKDSTGARRFWPVACGTMNHAWLRDSREQLLAQAVAEYKLGLPLYPNREDEATLIVPEQEMRTLCDPWEAIIDDYLNSSKQGNVTHESTVTLTQILINALNMEAFAMDGNRMASTRVGSIMARFGWKKCRETKGGRGYFYLRPKTADVVVNSEGVPF